MSKAPKKRDYSHVTPSLIKQINAVLDEADKHKYSVSRVYEAHNTAFQLRAVPQNCSSCLRNRVRDLRAWIRDYGGEPAQPPIPASEEHKEAPKPLTTEEVYVAMVERLGIAAAMEGEGSEMAVLNTILEPGYPNEISDAETDAVLARLIFLEKEAATNSPDAPYNAPGPDVVRYPMPDGGVPIDFTPNEPGSTQGTVLYADNAKVKAGTYHTATGHVIAVQPGSKANVKTEDLL